MLVKVVAFALVAFVWCADAAGWSYNNLASDGPSKWKVAYPKCGGSSQSPISIKLLGATYDDLGAPALSGYDVVPAAEAYELTNNGHTVQVNIKAGEFKISGAGLGDTYQLAQLHLHWGSKDCTGSEHTIDGQHFPAEMHLVHFNTKYVTVDEALKHADGLAVLGVMADIGSEDHSTFAKITDSLSAVKYAGSTDTIDSFAMDGLLPSDLNDFVRYSGSLTTPGCDEIVTWTVFRQPIYISEAQLDALRAVSHSKVGDLHQEALVNNYRPTQPLNGRVVTKTYLLDHLPSLKVGCLAL